MSLFLSESVILVLSALSFEIWYQVFLGKETEFSSQGVLSLGELFSAGQGATQSSSFYPQGRIPVGLTMAPTSQMDLVLGSTGLLWAGRELFSSLFPL